jgi:hypothetical protein
MNSVDVFARLEIARGRRDYPDLDPFGFERNRKPMKKGSGHVPGKARERVR